MGFGWVSERQDPWEPGGLTGEAVEGQGAVEETVLRRKMEGKHHLSDQAGWAGVCGNNRIVSIA